MANFVLESSVLADGSTRTQAKTILSLWHQVQSALELLSQTQGLLQHFDSGIISCLRHLPSGFPGHRAAPDSGNLANQGLGHLGGRAGGLLQAPEIPTMEPDREPHVTTGTCRVS